VKLGEIAGRLDRVQKSRRFKLIATVLVVVLGIGGFASWLVAQNAPGARDGAASSAQVQPERESPAPDAAQDETDRVLADADERLDERLDAEGLRRLLGARSSVVGVAIGVAIGMGVALIVVWLGLALTYLGLAAVVGVIAGPMSAIESTQGLARLLLGLTALAASFTAILEAIRLALGGRSTILAVARNVLNEAVRMKISIVFIVLLIFLLAALPGLLDPAQPLRYRVQTFLKWGVSGTYGVLALLTLFFSVATVAFEQRDRIIWQTMAKPVRPWEYLFGKWVGVMSVNLALLLVSASGVFLFTEYLRGLPAQGESAPYVNAEGIDVPTDDRLLLETQVLVARNGRAPTFPPIQAEMVEQLVEQRLAEALQRTDVGNPGLLEQGIRAEVRKDLDQARRLIAPGRSMELVFDNLGAARDAGRPLTLRYKLESGLNNPEELYRVVMIVDGVAIPREVSLDTMQTLTLRPQTIDENGRLVIEVINGDPFRGQMNRFSLGFPPDGVEILYVAGGYELNYLRVMAALWVKLGFIAAVGVAAASFLSFPVACFLAFLVLFSAQTASFLWESIDIFVGMQEKKGASPILTWIVQAIATPIAWAFSTYSELQPSRNLVEGRLLGWGAMLRSVAILGVWTVGVLAAGWSVFRKRELALYSGH
jgi:ABC-type transport system involved in multi-copper enzyme maturation permease subunit